jgi:hypothetical protein
MRIIIIGQTVLIISILVFNLMSSNFSEWLMRFLLHVGRDHSRQV